MSSISKRFFLTSLVAIGFLLPSQFLSALAASKFTIPSVSEGPTITTLTIGLSVTKKAVSLLNQKVGRGECTDLADEALRGAQPGSNYVWGTPVRKQSKIGTGAIIQFLDTQFSGPNGQRWGTLNGGQHTAVIIGVSGTAVNLIHQNFPQASPVVRGSIDLSWKYTGSYSIYRPIAQ